MAEMLFDFFGDEEIGQAEPTAPVEPKSTSPVSPVFDFAGSSSIEQSEPEIPDSEKLRNVWGILQANKDKPFVDRVLNPGKYPRIKQEGWDVTHKMAYAEQNGVYIVYPTVQMINGVLHDLGPKAGFDQAFQDNNFISFDNEADADYFSKNYKKIMMARTPSLQAAEKDDRTLLEKAIDKFAAFIGRPSPRELGKGERAMSLIELMAKEKGVPLSEFRESPEFIEQMAQGFTDVASAGLLPAAQKATRGTEKIPATTVKGQVGKAGGEFMGLLLGMKAVEPVLGPVLRKLPLASQGEKVAMRLLKQGLRESLVLGAAMGALKTGEAISEPTFREAAADIVHGIRSGAATGAIFGVSRGLFPKEAQNWAQRTITGMILLNAKRVVEDPQHRGPWDRPFSDIAMDTIMDVFFLWHGLPSKARADLQKRIERDVALMEERDNATLERRKEINKILADEQATIEKAIAARKAEMEAEKAKAQKVEAAKAKPTKGQEALAKILAEEEPKVEKIPTAAEAEAKLAKAKKVEPAIKTVEELRAKPSLAQYVVKRLKEHPAEVVAEAKRILSAKPAPPAKVEKVAPAETGALEASKITEPAVTYTAATKAKGKNVYVQTPRPTVEQQNNTERVLLAQVDYHLTQVKEAATPYFDKLYEKREGYQRPDDFWEVPEWAAEAANTFKNGDFYSIRDVDEAVKFLNTAGYKAVMFSAMDVNKEVVRQIAEKYDGKIIVGGYVNKAFFKGLKNVEWHDTIESAAKSLGVEYKPGADLRHFQRAKTIPRLCMSKGCLHKCAFCTVPKKVKPTAAEAIDQQLKNFQGLDYELIYLDDKTFGQSPNYKDLVNIFKKVKSKNPRFKGFIIQTTAPQLLKLPDEFLDKSGIKYVELGVESYNNDILKRINKPHTTELIDKAVAKLRDHDIAFVPNIMVGLAGKDKAGKLWTETKESYQNTLDFLDRNEDIISHVNVYNLALYEGTELGKQIEEKTDTDVNENAVERSYLKDKALHNGFYKKVLAFGERMLDKTPKAAPAQPGAKAGEFRSATVGHFNELVRRVKNKYRSYMTPWTKEEMEGITRYENQDVAYALTPAGELTNLVNVSGKKGAGKEGVLDAISHGAKTVSVYDNDFLPQYYHDFGFKAFKSESFDYKKSPPGWSIKDQGMPDIVWMRYEGPKDIAEARAKYGTYGEYTHPGVEKVSNIYQTIVKLPEVKETKYTPGTTPGKIGNKWILTSDGIRYESKLPIHSDIFGAFKELDGKDIAVTGIIASREGKPLDQKLSLGSLYHMSNKQLYHLKQMARAVLDHYQRANAPPELLARLKVKVTPWVEVDPEVARKSLKDWEARGFDISEPSLLAFPEAISWLSDSNMLVQLSMYHKNFGDMMTSAYHAYFHALRTEGYISKGDMKVLDTYNKNEEFQADLFADIASDSRAHPNLPGPVKRVFLRMKSLFQFLYKWLTGKNMRTANDVMGDLLAGRFARPRVSKADVAFIEKQKTSIKFPEGIKKAVRPPKPEEIGKLPKRGEMPAVDAISDMMGERKKPEDVTGAWVKLDRAMFDRFAVLKKPAPQTYDKARTYQSYKDQASFKMEELRDILKPVYEYQDLFSRYVAAHRAWTRAIRDIKNPNNVTAEQAQTAILDIERFWMQAGKDLNALRGAFEGFQTWANVYILRDALNSGIISKKMYKDIVDNNRFYATFDVIEKMPPDLKGVPSGITGEYFSVANQGILKKMVGTEKKIADPMEATVKKFTEAQALYARNKVASSLVDELGIGDLLRPVATSAKQYKILEQAGKNPVMEGAWDKSQFDTINRFKDGRVEKYVTPRYLADAMKQLTPFQAPRVIQMVNSVFRASATTVNLGFAIGNAARDAFMAYNTVPVYRARDILGPFQMDWAKGAWEATKAEFLNKPSIVKDYLEAGGGFGYQGRLAGAEVYEPTGAALRRIKLFQETSPVGKAMEVIKKPIDLIERINSVIEMAPRLGTFTRAKKLGYSSKDAAFMARQATIDFNRGGVWVKAINQFVPFLNARVQARVVLATAFKKDFHNTLAKLVVSTVIPGMAVYAWNRLYYSDLYDDIPDYIKQNYFVMIYGSKKDEKGRTVPKYFVIAKGDTGQMTMNPLEYGMDQWWVKDRQSAGEFLVNFLSDLSPVEFARKGEVSLYKAAGSLVPPMVKPVLEDWANLKFYQGTEIVPYYMKKTKPPELQYKEDTPELYKWLGDKLKIAPLRLQNYSANLLTSYGREGFSPVAMAEGIKGRLLKSQGGANEQRAWVAIKDIENGYVTVRAYVQEFLKNGDIRSAKLLVDEWNRSLNSRITEYNKQFRGVGLQDKGGLRRSYYITGEKYRNLYKTKTGATLIERKTARRTRANPIAKMGEVAKIKPLTRKKAKEITGR